MTPNVTSFVNSTLADICSLVTDGTHDTPKRVESGYPLVKAKEIVGGQIDFDTCDQISESDHLAVIARSKPERGDTLFAHIGASLGEAAYVNTKREFSIKNIALFKPNPKIIDGRYLYYVVVGPTFQGTAKAAKTGSAQPFLSLGHLRSHPIQYHKDIRMQRRIAGILSAYDDLIDVNTRRIAILEEMARRLFDEWFTRDEQQEAWLETKVDGIADVYRGRSYKGTELAEAGGLPFVNLKCIARDGGFRPDGIKRYTGQYKESQTVTSGDLVIAVTDMTQERRIVGQCGRVPMLDAPYGVVSMDLVKIAPKDHAERDWLYAWLRWSPFPWNVRQHANGTNVLHLSMDRITEYKLARPPTELTHKYSRIVSPNFQLSERLLKQNELLRAACDLLLPKLISGEIDLERAERGVETATTRAAAE